MTTFSDTDLDSLLQVFGSRLDVGAALTQTQMKTWLGIVAAASAILVESGASAKISALSSAGALAGTESVPVVQAGATVKTTLQAIANLAPAAAAALLVESGIAEKISALSAAGALAGTETIPMVQGGATVAATAQAIANLAASGGQTLYAPITAPVDGNYSWVNQGSASVTVNGNGGIALRIPTGSGVNLRGRVLTQPATPYTLTAAFLFTMQNVSNMEMGLFFSDGTKFSTWEAFTGGPDLHCGHWTNSSTFGTDAVLIAANVSGPGLHWLRIANSGTVLTYSYSSDGYNYVSCFTENVGTYLTPTQIGFHGINNMVTHDAISTLLSWKLT